MTTSAIDLIGHIHALRGEYLALLDAHRVLLDCGIESHTHELRDRLAAIATDAAEITQRLYLTGADTEFHQAHQLWTTIVGHLNALHLNPDIVEVTR